MTFARAHIGDGAREAARLLNENAALADRLRKLGQALSTMAHELASVRRENAALRRENLRLQMLVQDHAHALEWADTRPGRAGDPPAELDATSDEPRWRGPAPARKGQGSISLRAS